ncbi:MAG: alpha/beta hydrolase [Deltaproteobacteria bacterium]|nr:MAG: alpha/beta hydrolase [Deltaproteobacteria bacterium]
MIERRLASFDGTEIAYQLTGEGPRTIVLANGLGGTYAAWSLFVEAFRDRYRILSWDYRGLYDSACPKDRKTLQIPFHCEDLRLIMDAEGIDRAILAGWSMGVQVILEFCGRHPERVAALIPINGAFGRPFETVPYVPFPGRLLPLLLRLMRRSVGVLQPSVRWISKNPRLVYEVIRRVGLIKPHTPREIFEDLAHAFMNLDLDVYCEIMERLGEHDASWALDKITVPTLIVASGHDIMTPPMVAHKMMLKIPHAEYLHIPMGTHYAPLEFAEFLNLRIEKFLRDHDLLP